MFERLLRRLVLMIVGELQPHVHSWIDEAVCKIPHPTHYTEHVTERVVEVPAQTVMSAPLVSTSVPEEAKPVEPAPVIFHSCGHHHHSYATNFKTYESICIECHNKRMQ